MTAGQPIHIGLEVEGAPAGQTQPVEVVALGDDDYRVLYSPGFVEGVAAGDVIRVHDATTGAFTVITRGGNVVVKISSPDPFAGTQLDDATADLAALGGRFDGAIETAAVWTIPVTASFRRIEEAMNRIVRRIPGSEWWYGNVYDANGEPLGWWEKG